MQYGVINERNQIMMAAPCMGLGIFDESGFQDYQHDSLRHRNSIACCSRGGIVWVLPTRSFNYNSDTDCDINEEVIMYQMPYDQFGDDDGLPRYMQGFAAGYVKMKCWRSREVRVEPLIFHAWSGGLIDVYACDMAMELEQPDIMNKTLFDLLLDNGAIHQLVKYLLGQECDNINDINTDLLEKARKECNDAGQSVNDIVEQMKIDGVRGFEAFNDLIYTLGNLTA